MSGLLSQYAILGSSGMLLAALVVLWRKTGSAYIVAYRWQSWILAALTALIGFFAGDPALYRVAVIVLLVKGVLIPALLRATERRLGPQREMHPYVNAEASLLVAGLLGLFAYTLARPWVFASHLPTRAGLPLAMALLFISLFIVASRKKAITQVVGFLMLENAVALLAVLGTYGVPLLVDLGVLLDVLMGFLVMQIFMHDIHETFDSLDVEHLRELKH
jgi:hydrogenase-4 component E